MKITILGGRGSTPAPGDAFRRFGGHTSCIAVSLDDGGPTLLLDAGTGIRNVAAVLGEQPFRGTVLLGHLHWDHTAGLPFFTAGDRDDARVRVFVPRQPGADEAMSLIVTTMSPPHFPITPDGLRGEWSFEWLDEGEHDIEVFTVTAREIPHPGGRTFGFRVSDAAGASLAYLSDHAPQAIGPGRSGVGAIHPAALELANEVDVLVHDAHFTRCEFEAFSHYGHSCADYAAELAAAAGARRLLLFHHHPDRTDDEADAIVAATRAWAGVAVDAAEEGMVIDL